METFEVSVTPKWKKKVVVDPSPILMLERFKGTPSLLFKELKVGQSSTKGLWIQNSNDCTVTVSMTRLPPAERGLTFSETEFNLDTHESKRVEVTWLPTCPGSWRDVVDVQVWGLPPPHLKFRLVLHLTSVEPKPKHKCCHVNPPLRARNVRRPSSAAGGKAAAPVASSCPGCCKRNVKKLPKSGAATTTGAATARGPGKENAPSNAARIVIRAKGALTKAHVQQHQPSTGKQQSSKMDEDSLEEEGVAPVAEEPFLPVEDGAVLPPCSIPSTPIRRVTYNVRGKRLNQEKLSLQSPPTPINAATFTVSEDGQQRVEDHGLRFIQVMKGIEFSPLKVPDHPSGHATKPGDLPLTSVQSDAQWSLLPISQDSSTSILNEGAQPRPLFPLLNADGENVGAGVKRFMPSQSSPILGGAVGTASSARPPQCSPIQPHDNAYAQRGDFCRSAAGGFTDIDSKAVLAIINDTYTKPLNANTYEHHTLLENVTTSVYAPIVTHQVWDDELSKRVAAEKEAEKLKAVRRAACIIQKNWRRLLAMKLAAKLRAERLEKMNEAAYVIQKNWRHVLVKRQARRLRAEKIEEINKATIVFQKNWRRLLVMRLATKLRAERLQKMNEAANVIQKSWRHVLAKRQARKFRAEKIKEINEAAIVFQKNWRCLLAMRFTAKLRAERLEKMNKAAYIIQKNWRHVLIKRQARKLRAEKIEEINKAALIIQRNWRCLLAVRFTAKLRAERLEAMNKAADIIQRNWRHVLAKHQARKFRAGKIKEINEAAIVFQKNWRRLLVMRLATKLRAERLQKMNEAANVIQKSWRHVLAKRQARKFRAEKIEEINEAAIVFQKNWRCLLAMRFTAKLRAERLEKMNKAAYVIQKNWRHVLIKRQARKLRAEKIEEINKAALIIQRNWRRLLVVRFTAKLRAERLEAMNKAACIIQTNWRRVLCQRLAAALRAERANDYSELCEEFAIKVCSKFHLERSQFDLLHRLVSLLPPEQDVTLAYKYMQNGLRNKLLAPMALTRCDKATQTLVDQATSTNEFIKPKMTGALRRRAVNEKHEMPLGARRSLCLETKALRGSARRSCGVGEGLKGRVGAGMSPIQRKLGQKEVPEKERWSSVAEAVGCTPRK